MQQERILPRTQLFKARLPTLTLIFTILMITAALLTMPARRSWRLKWKKTEVQRTLTL